MKATATFAATLASTILLLGAAPRPRPADIPQDPAPPSAKVEPFPAGYLDHDRLTAALRKLAEAHPKALKLSSLAKTAQGRDVWLATIGRPVAKAGRPGPSILLVANLEADQVAGSQLALGLIERLAGADGDDQAVTKLLDEHVVYVAPRLNPDGAERLLKEPRADGKGNLRPIDRDRDGKAGEDGPDDLNGDGVLTRMRLRDDKATLLAEDKEARTARKADPAKGERAVFSEYPEGVDDDGDQAFNEDPAGGVDLGRNWPHRWTEFDPETGVSPVAEPETRALVQFAFDHPEIAIAWSLGPLDNLRAEPKKPGSTLDDADLPLFAELARAFGRASKPAVAAEPTEEKKADEGPAEKPAEAKKDEPARKGAGRGGRGGQGAPTSTAPPAAGPGDGAFHEWAYHQYGVVGLATAPWTGPDLPEAKEGDPKPPADGEARWLWWNDKVLGGAGFVPFAEVDHPKLGTVEVGGWKPGVKANPPIDQVGPIADRLFAYLKDLGGRFARLELPEPEVEARGGGLFAITARVENAGYLPTALAQGVRTRTADPVLVRLTLPEGAKVLTGPGLVRIDALAGSGGSREYRWLVLAPGGGRAELEASCPKAGRATRAIELR